MYRKAKDVGIIGIEIYFPRQYVSQAELEKEYGVPAGKYTIGLGQINMAFVEPWEDVNSISFTVVQNLLEKYKVDPRNVGRLEIGTETLIDKSKSTKTVLMELFAKHGNHDIEGVSSLNACYGATNALFNTINWMQSESWDGRLGIVVAADIAVYDKGPARPTGGAGAVAILIGPEAPIVMESIRSTYMTHAYDFYKPDAMSEFPTVDGQLSVKCYHDAIKHCYEGLKSKYQQTGRGDINLDKLDYCCFHSPFCKMVYRSFITLMNVDLKEGSLKGASFDGEIQKRLQEIKGTETSADSKENAGLLKAYWEKKAKQGTYLSSQLGNIYAGSLYCGLISLISNDKIDLENKRIMMFSYGSGLASSMFILHVRSNVNDMRKKLRVPERLAARVKVTPDVYEKIMDSRKSNFNKAGLSFTPNLDLLEDGAYYLVQIDPKFRRTYARKSQGKIVSKNSLSFESKEATSKQLSETTEQGVLGRLKMIQGHLMSSKAEGQ